MFTISNEDRKRLLALLDLTQGLKPNNLRDENRLRLARQALKRLERKDKRQ